MKKFIKILVIFLIALELVAYLNVLAEDIKNNDVHAPYSNKIRLFEEVYADCPNFVYNPFGKNYGLQYNARPIVIFGDSAAYGEEVDEQFRISPLLSEKVKRPVFNKSLGGWSVQHMYFQLNLEDLYNDIKNPEYVVFIYTPQMLRLMYAPNLCFPLKYTVKNGKLERVPHWVFKFCYSYTISKINDAIAYYKAQNFDKAFDDFKIYLIESRKEAKKHWKDAKFVIIKYSDKTNKDNLEKWKELEKEGYTVIEMSDILGEYYSVDEKFCHQGSYHPTNSVWQEALPEIIKKMKI